MTATTSFGVDVPGYVPAHERPLLLTKDQAAVALTISARQLERLVASGDVIPTRIGGAIRFAPRELDAFVERSTMSRVAWPTARRVAVRGRR